MLQQSSTPLFLAVHFGLWQCCVSTQPTDKVKGCCLVPSYHRKPLHFLMTIISMNKLKNKASTEQSSKQRELSVDTGVARVRLHLHALLG